MDMITLLSVTTMVAAVASAFTWFLHFHNRGLSGTLTIAFSNTFFLIGFGLISLRTHVNGFLSFIVANDCICVGHLLIIIGLQQFFCRKSRLILLSFIFVFYDISFCYWYYVEPTYQKRLVLFLMTYATLMLYSLMITLSEYKKQRLKSYLVSSAFMALLAIQFYACSGMTLLGDNGPDILSITTVNQSVVFEQILFLIGWTLSFSLMISERLSAENAMAEHRYRALVEGAPDAIMVYDVDQELLIDANSRAEEMFACRREDLLKGGPLRFFAPTQPDGKPALISFQDSCARVLAGASFLIERELINSNGQSFSAEVRLSPLPSTNRRLIRGSFLDISQRKATEAHLQFLATHDILTELPNRLLLLDRFSQAVQVSTRNGTKTALLFADLDSFKSINDSFGHVVGDQLLQRVAVRLCQCVRKTDTVSRHGGDEFLLLLTNLPDGETAAVITKHITTETEKPFMVAGQELYTSVSIGIALFPDDGKDYVTLRKKSDLAMYRAKEVGKNTFRFFDSEIDFDVVEHQKALTDLQGALARKEFALHYQPQFDLTTGRLVGAEALLRWQHPVRGMVPPGRFIPLAESSGLIVPIGDWVLFEACRQAAEWHADAFPGLVVAINLSAVQFKRDNLEEKVAAAIASSGINPGLLELELTESILIRDTEAVLATVNRLRALGVKLSIDDFVTGYSSLSYLKRFNVDKVKIDQSFIRDIATDASDATIVKAICMMARGLNLRTVAEGVEDESHLTALRAFACDEGQGYFFARPLPPSEFSRRATLWAAGNDPGRGPTPFPD